MQQMQFLLQAAKFCPFYIPAIFSVGMKDHGFVQNHAKIFLIADIKSFDSFLLRCNQQWKKKKCPPFGDSRCTA